MNRALAHPPTRVRPAVFEAPTFRRGPLFGREGVLEDLNAIFAESGGPVAIHGMPGVGKTAVAAAFAHARKNGYAGVWRAVADRRETLIQSLAALGARLDLGIAALHDPEAAARAALSRVAGASRPWLIIYDDVKKPTVIEEFLPSSGTHLIIATRWAHWPASFTSYGLDVLPRSASIAMLKTRTGRNDVAAAGRLAAQLGDLPVALDHAAAYCKHLGLGFDTYGALLPDLIRRAPHGAEDQPSLFEIFDQAILCARKNAPEAERLLGLLSFFAPEDVPIDLIGDSAMKPIERGEAIAALSEASLLEIAEDGLSVHPLIRQAMRVRLESRGQAAEIGALAIRSAADAFPCGAGEVEEPHLSPIRARLLPHALSALSDRHAEREAGAAAGRLLNQAGLHLQERGAYADAERLMRRALATAEATYGPDHPNAAVCLNNLSLLLQEMDRFEEAEALIRRALAIDEAAYGPDHPEVGAGLNALAGLLQDTGRFPEAEDLQRRALAIAENAYGADHPETAHKLNNLAGLLQDAGRHAEAEPLHRRALAIDEAALGPDHPNVGADLNNLAQLLRATGRAAEAEPMMHRALRITEAAYGAEHPAVASRLMSLAQALQQAGRRAEAELLMRRALAVSEAAYGSDDQKIAADLATLAELLEEEGRFAEAESFLRRALTIDEAALAPDHPDVAADLNMLADLLTKTNRYAEAEPLARRALDICEAKLGSDHVATRRTRMILVRIQTKLESRSPDPRMAFDEGGACERAG